MIRLDPKFAGPNWRKVKESARNSVEQIVGDTSYEETEEGILVRNIQVISPDGFVRESYPKLYVDRNIVRDNNKEVRKKPYEWITYFEEKNGFLPSIALSCNLLAYMFEHKDDSVLNAVLMTYKDKRSGFGWHCQNSLNAFGSNKIIHYPHRVDFPEHGGNIDTNQGRKYSLDFDKKDLKDMTVGKAIKRDDGNLDFLQKYSCLPDVRILVEIGNYFDKLAKLWFPWNGRKGQKFNRTRAAWLGCGYNSFDIDANGNLLINNDAASGVREPVGRA